MEVKTKKGIFIKIISIIVFLIIVFLLIGSKSTASSVAEKYLKARYKCDAKQIVSLVPNSIIKNITDEYDCSRSQLVEVVEKELEYDKKEYVNCDLIKSSEENKYIDEDYYKYHIDSRLEDCIEIDNIKYMGDYKVDVNNDYYFTGIMVFKYGTKYYSLDAANFVAHAVWEYY